MLSLTIFTGEGEDMVFTIYGDHWRRRRRIMTPKVDASGIAFKSLITWSASFSQAKHALQTTLLVCKRLQLMMSNIIYRLMFNS
jgi:trans-cinnamate 4-monooxygenase